MSRKRVEQPDHAVRRNGMDKLLGIRRSLHSISGQGMRIGSDRRPAAGVDQGLYIEREPGACGKPIEKSQEAFGSIFKFANGCWDLRPTKAVLSMWIAMGLLALILFLGRSRDQNGVPRGTFANIIEALLLFVRDEIAIANIGKEDGPK